MPVNATKVTMDLAFANGTIVTKTYYFTSNIDTTTNPAYKQGTGFLSGQSSANQGALKVCIDSDKYEVLCQHHESVEVS